MVVAQKAKRNGPKKKLKLFGGNMIYLDSGTRENMNLVLKFLQKEYRKAKEDNKRPASFTYLHISKCIGKHNTQVSYACTLLAFSGRVRITPSKRFSKKRGCMMTSTKVHYLPLDKRKKVR